VSGYFGVAQLDARPVDDRLLGRVADALAFRGPHGRSVWKTECCGGCFTRMDTNSGPPSKQQPVALNERFFLWGDVRLDAQRDLRAQLGESTPAPVNGCSSEELLLQAWCRYGEAALERVLGDFSFALWDARDRILFCARDFVGARPLYYSQAGAALYVGNTLNVFHCVPQLSRELDEMFIGDFLLEGASRDPWRTVYREIHRLPPGHLLKFSSAGTEVRRFCKLAVEQPLELADEREYVDAYLELLRESVNDRLPQGSTSLYLSGGLDSGSVCAIAAEIAGARGQKDQLKAFTFAMPALFNDREPDFAARSAKHLGIAHEILSEPELIAFAGADSPDWQVPEPDQEYFFLRERKLAQKVAEHSNVVLGGDGGDDILAGQSWPYLVHLWRQRAWKRMARDFGGYLAQSGRFPPLRAGLRAKIRGLFQTPNDSAGYPLWLNPEFEARLNLRERWGGRVDSPPGTDLEHPLHPQAFRALHSGYWASVLETEDAGWNGVPLEVRDPLLDLRILRFLLRLPPVPWCMNKMLSRRAMTMKLPDNVLQRPKTPLAGDPLEHCACSAARHVPLANNAKIYIERFVNWDKWCETLVEPKGPSSEGSLSWLRFRPVSLAYWLKAVENRMGIQ